MSNGTYKINPNFNPNNLLKYLPVLVVILVVFFALTNTTFLTLQPGEAGVLFKRFGDGINKDKIYGQGFHVVAPWNRMIIYDVRIQENLERMQVLSKNGLTINCDLSYRYQPVSEKIGYLHEEIGVNYHKNIIIPEIRSATREVIGKYLPDELYSTKRDAIQSEIFESTKIACAKKNIILDAVLIREVKLPESLQKSIETKLNQEQESLAYEFKLDKARQEADRQRIEAEGKAKANKIISNSLTDKILQEKGIEATLKLAESNNAKTVIIGSSEGGMPLILGR